MTHDQDRDRARDRRARDRAPFLNAVRLGYRVEPSLIGWHEAGHAVAAYRIGLRVQAASINRGACTGATHVEAPEDSPWTPQTALVVHAAGRVAERMAPAWHGAGGVLAGLLPDQDPDDACWRNQQACLREICGFDAALQQDLLAEVRRQLEAMLGSARATLAAFSSALLARGSLDGAACLRILDASQPRSAR